MFFLISERKGPQNLFSSGSDPEYVAFSEQIGKTKHLALTDVSYLVPIYKIIMTDTRDTRDLSR
jgi:hypothetical protein